MTIHRLDIGGARLTRVGHLDLPVPPELLGLTAAAVAALPWSPRWASDGQPRIGAATWFADIGGRRLAFDPFQALDAVLRPDPDTEAASQDAIEARFAEAGFPAESVDVLVMTHIDGIGMAARRATDGLWQPFFPNARILLSEAELTAFQKPSTAEAEDPARQAWAALLDQGRIDTYADGEAIVPGLMAEVSGGHGPGHAVFHLQGDPPRHAGPALSFIGHLAVTPLHLATGECSELNEDPARAWTLLHEVADDGRLLVGNLWPAPGCGRWADGEVVPGC